MQTNQTKQFESTKVRTSFKREKQEDGWIGGQTGRITLKI